ncbi:MAG: class I SAM-dependent methyltransferase [Deltaproteobacteria bacterium]|nr:class I SAM-dependent methyltransferase [Deltaproteobacteria bacterium]
MKDLRVFGAALLVGGFGLGFLVRPHVERAGTPPAPSASASASAPKAQASVSASPSSSSIAAETKVAFENVYKNATWGTNDAGVGNSGTGSTLDATLLYRTFLQQFIRNNEIRSVVDAGCGDWEFSSAIDWTGIDYKGYDIASQVIAHDKKTYAKPNIQFFEADIVEQDLPKADLLVSKHVLQHLPNASVKKFLDRHVGRYKHILITSGVDHESFVGGNGDIAPGLYRTLDPTAPPFNVPGLKILTYTDGYHMHQVVHIGDKPRFGPPSPSGK